MHYLEVRQPHLLVKHALMLHLPPYRSQWSGFPAFCDVNGQREGEQFRLCKMLPCRFENPGSDLSPVGYEERFQVFHVYNLATCSV